MGRRQGGVRAALSPPTAAVLLILLPAVALAQGSSVLIGTVRDASTLAPLANVMVTATSPALLGEQIVITDAAGEYRVPQLPPGTYALRFEREDHKPFSREGIDVSPGYTLRFNAELIPEIAGATTVAVVGKPPLVDVGSTQQGTIVDQDFIRTIPVAPPNALGGNSRSFETLALTVPTARGDLYGVALKGTTSPENSYLIDGLSTRNTSYGISGSQLSVEFVDSVAVVTGGYLPEFGRTTGGIIAANTKSGGNEFRGSVWGTWTPGALAGTAHSVPQPNSVISFRTEPHNIVDFGASLGGYIIKDRLWFFVGVQPEFSRYRVFADLKPFRINPDGSQFLDANGKPQAEGTINTRPAFADEHQLQYFGKLTYLLSDDHRLALTVTGNPSHSGGSNAYRFSSLQPGQAAVGTAVGTPGAIYAKGFDGSFDTVGKLSSSFAEKRLLLDVTTGWHHEDHELAPIDGSKLGSTDPTALVNQPAVRWANRSITEYVDLPPSVVADCLSDQHGGANRCPTQFWTGGPPRVRDIRYDSLQAKAVLTVLFQGAGHHVLKLGLDGDVSTSEGVWSTPGNGFAIETRAGRPFQVFRRGYLAGPDTEEDLGIMRWNSKSVLLGGFVQDSWSILDRITLNAGVRFDTQTLYGTAGDVAVSFPHEWSPRVGLIWDPTQLGRAKVYASYARYYENVPLDLADRGFGQEIQAAALYPPASGNCNPRSSLTASCISPDKVLQGAYGIPPNPTWFVLAPYLRNTVDPALKPPSEDEWVAGLDYEILPNTRASLAYTHRQIVDWVEDMSTNNAVSYFLGNPGEGIATTFPFPHRIYNAFVLSVDKTFADLWLAQVSYSYQNLHGNIEGLYREQTGQLDPNINSDFDLQRLIANREGPLAGDVRHTIKAYLAKEFVLSPSWSVVLGAGYSGASGRPIDFLGADALTGYGNGEVFVFPRGAAGRLGWLHTVDVNGAISVHFSSTTALTLSVNVFNLFNFQQVTSVDNDYTRYPQGVAPVPNGNPATDRNKIVDDITGKPLTASQINQNFLQPASYQPVRQVRFQARMSF